MFCHVRDFNHVLNFDECDIVFKSDNYIKRRIVESSLISSLPNFNLSDGQYSFNKIICNRIMKCIKMPRGNVQTDATSENRSRDNPIPTGQPPPGGGII